MVHIPFSQYNPRKQRPLTRFIDCVPRRRAYGYIVTPTKLTSVTPCSFASVFPDAYFPISHRVIPYFQIPPYDTYPPGSHMNQDGLPQT